MNWGWINDLRIISFYEATGKNPTPEYFVRCVNRWYGQTYGMSPHLVEELPLYDVLRHYFEVQATEAAEDEPRYQSMLRSIVYGDEETIPETVAAIEDDEFMQQVKAGAYAKKGPAPQPVANRMAEAISLPKAEEPPLPEFEMVDFSELNQMDQAENAKLPPPPAANLSRLERARRQR